MLRSLVGSEMCIRDSTAPLFVPFVPDENKMNNLPRQARDKHKKSSKKVCFSAPKIAIEMKLSSNRVVIRTSSVAWLTSNGCTVFRKFVFEFYLCLSRACLGKSSTCIGQMRSSDVSYLSCPTGRARSRTRLLPAEKRVSPSAFPICAEPVLVD